MNSGMPASYDNWRLATPPHYQEQEEEPVTYATAAIVNPSKGEKLFHGNYQCKHLKKIGAIIITPTLARQQGFGPCESYNTVGRTMRPCFDEEKGYDFRLYPNLVPIPDRK